MAYKRRVSSVYISNERPIDDVPGPVWVILVIALALQILWHAARPDPVATARPLPVPPPVEKLELLGLGDSIATARILTLWLQSFDNQPGISIPFRQLDYRRLAAWLNVILTLDDQGQYPLLAASLLYSEVPDEGRKRQMLEFVYQKFLADPDRRWPSLAHAVFVAKHRLRDLPLALRYGRALAEHVAYGHAPYWARQLHIHVLEDMGELEDARALIAGLLESGEIKDRQELKFLKERLNHMAQVPAQR
jgi:hypothetical protein